MWEKTSLVELFIADIIYFSTICSGINIKIVKMGDCVNLELENIINREFVTL